MKDRLEDEIDALFRLPLAEFTSARNTLAARLKKGGRRNDADRVKLLAKPSVSAWAVNQLYWEHRKAFDQLIATSRLTGKVAAMRGSLDARREALADLSELAAELLRGAGHNPAADTVHRITTTLEAMSAYASRPEGPLPGRLTQDLDPPSFESLASLMSGAGATESTRIKAPQKPATIVNTRRLQEIRQAKITAAKVSLQDAKKSLSDARAKAQGLEAEQKKANVEVKEAEKYRREAQERLEKATAAAGDAVRRARTVATDVASAAKAVEDAKRTVEGATKELESVLRGS